MTFHKTAVFVFILLGSFISPLSGEDLNRPTTVVGFINIGESDGGKINTILTKSLINYLSKIPGAVITPYEQTEQMAANKYWKLKSANTAAAVKIAQYFDSRQTVTGTYQINGKKASILIQVLDTVTGDLRLEKRYEVKTGPDLMDTVDEVSRSVAGLLAGRSMEYSVVQVSAESTGIYDLFINGKNLTQLSNQSVFNYQFIAGQELEISLRLTNNKHEVYREEIPDLPATNIIFIYKPSGKVIFKAAVPNTILLVDKTNRIATGMEGTVSIPNIEAGISHSAELTLKGVSIDKQNFSVQEGSETIVLLGTKPITAESKLSPLWNLALPGLIQYREKAYWQGFLFTGIWAASAGFTAFSIYGSAIVNQKISIASNAADRTRFQNLSNVWTGMIIGGSVVFAADTFLSVYHVYNLPEYKPAEQNASFQFTLSDDLLALKYSYRF